MDGKIIKKSEDLNYLIDRTGWSKLKLVKYLSSLTEKS